MKTRIAALSVAAGFLAGFSPSAGAAFIEQTVNQPNNDIAQGWNGAVWGDPPATLTSGNHYLVPSGMELRVLFNHTTFQGESLTVQGLLHVGPDHRHDILFTANINLDGGTLRIGKSDPIVSRLRGGPLNVVSDSRIDLKSGLVFSVEAMFLGSGNLTIDMDLCFVCVFWLPNSSTFSGTLDFVTGRNVQRMSAVGFGGQSDSCYKDASLFVRDDYFMDTVDGPVPSSPIGLPNHLTLRDVTIARGGDVNDTFSLPPGTYTAMEANAVLGANIFSGKPGNLTVVPEPSSYALLLGGLVILLAGCLRRRQAYP
ncbi:MAG: PEP-CTERM sorting domain-containing protein [Puniceicoccaceae bacterium]|nr:MAG: PEP-CTERM sorting domain-containing protein [Puniceicoccaceae bacterium]